MNVPFVDLPSQIAPYEKELRSVVDEVMFKRADFIMRQDLLDFEAAFAEFTGTKYAVGLANGSDALNIALRVLGIGPGDEVITVSHTFVATIAAIVHAGATPVLADVGEDHNLECESFEKLITKKSKAIMPVHLNGRTCQMDRVMQLAKENGLHVIEDSAQAIGANYDGQNAGTFGVMSTNSFYPFKVLGCFGDGGAITTDDDEINYKLRCMRDNGQDRSTGEILFWGWNSRLDNLQAAILLVLMRHLPHMIKRRREVAATYTDGFKGISDLEIPEGPDDENRFFNVFQNYVVCTPKRDEFVEYLNENGVGTLISWPTPTHFHPALGLSHFSLPNTERISREVVSLPMHPALNDAEVNHVIQTVTRFFD